MQSPNLAAGTSNTKMHKSSRFKKMLMNVPSDFMSFSTFYNKEPTQSNYKKKQGVKKISCFELINFMSGRSMSSVFDIKGKKKDILL